MIFAAEAEKQKDWLMSRSDVDPLKLAKIGLPWDPLCCSGLALCIHTDKTNNSRNNNLIWRISKQLWFYAVIL